MKKYLKKSILLFLTVILVVISVITVGAETVYDYYGLKFTIINNFSVSIAGCEETTTDVIIPAEINGRTVVGIKNWAFMDNSTIQSIDFTKANNMQYIGMFSFSNCTGLQGELKIPDTVTNIDSCAFEGCSGITGIKIGTKLSSIPNQCYNKCTLLSEVSLPESVESIGNYAFANCPNLTYLELSEKVTSIANSTFQNDENLTLGVWYGSYGYEYAKTQNIPYILLDSALLGDANGDGYVNVNDVTAIQRHAAELELLEDIYFHAADINGDGDVSVDDATELQRFLAEYVVDYPIGEVMTQ